ncbi:Atu4866 domain-containing protein [Streptomyces sp. NPDC102274]|uniref:Atu4866 domain-containing protein n=1 Tax=Streptomyces sp. NPDC102274 TaxID=3366151 RepID=UPI0037FB1B49
MRRGRRYTITGNRIYYVDDTAFTTDGVFVDRGTLHHGDCVFHRETEEVMSTELPASRSACATACRASTSLVQLADLVRLKGRQECQNR